MAFVMLFLPVVHGQQSMNTSGADAVGIGGSMSFSIGQIAYETYNGSSGTISQGVQQAYLEIMVGNEELSGDFSIRLFPNPSSAYTSIALDEIEASASLTSFSYQLYDLYGHFIRSAVIQSAVNDIPTTNLVSGMYILKVLYKNQPIKTFRFIKTE